MQKDLGRTEIDINRQRQTQILIDSHTHTHMHTHTHTFTHTSIETDIQIATTTTTKRRNSVARTHGDTFREISKRERRTDTWAETQIRTYTQIDARANVGTTTLPQ